MSFTSEEDAGMVTAMLFDGPGRPFRRVESESPKLGDCEVLVRVRLCTLCGSDLHTASGRRYGPTPCVLGHEMVADVVQIGGGGRNTVDGTVLQIGDRIVWSVADSCGTCFYCLNHLPQKCTRLLKYGHIADDPKRGPLGGLATHVHLLAGTTLVRIPADIPDEVAAPAMCSTATVAGAVRNAGGLKDRRVLILGAGLLGLTTAAMARAAGAQLILVADTASARLGAVERFGADRGLLIENTETAREAVLASTQGRGADVIFEMSGAAAAVALAISSVRIGGKIVLIGSVFPSEPVPVRAEDIVRRCLTLVGVHNYTPDDLRSAMQFLEVNHRRFPFVEAVAATFALNDVDAAFQMAEQERPFRVGVRP